MIKRTIEKQVQFAMQQFPIVTLLGIRQSGKTTLAQKVFPDFKYCNLESPDTRQLASADPHSFFQQYSPPVILDEVQRVPELFSYIQVLSDKLGKKGQFLLTGSHQYDLHALVSQSLAGRTAVFQLLPLSLSELIDDGKKLERDLAIFSGGFPRLHADGIDPTLFYRSYFQTYVERDLRQLVQVRNISKFETFVRLLAGRTGQLLNLSALSGDIGISVTTLNDWLSILESSFVIFRIFPHHSNRNKRLAKTPKVYFSDTGLACYLLGIESVAQVGRDPLLGALFETLVVMECVKSRFNAGKDINFTFYREQDRHEVDLLVKEKDGLHAMEIKAAKTWDESFWKGIEYLARTRVTVSPGYVVYAGDLEFNNDDRMLINYLKTNVVFRDESPTS